jgi:signal transduction histidine kinase
MNITLVVIGIGCFFLSYRWLTLILAIAVLGWVYSTWPAVPSLVWIRSALTLLSAILISALVHTIRVRTFQGLERMRIQNERREQELTISNLELERSQEALREQTRISQSILDSMGDGVIVADKHGKFLLFNPAAERIVGIGSTDTPPEEWSNKYGIFYPDMVTPFPPSQLPLVRATRGETCDDVELFVRNSNLPNGVFISITGRPLRDEKGVVRGGVVVFRDITERKRIEQMKGDFVSLVSHQLKTPVAQISGYIDNMLAGLTGPLTEKQQQYLHEMQEVSARNYRLIADLLNVSRIERGIISVYVQPANLIEIVNLAVREYRADIKKKRLALNLAGMDNDVIVLADVDKMVETVINVIDNAVKFTNTGSMNITVKSDGDWGIVEIADTGPGMAPEVLNNLFTKEKVLSGRPTATGGAGLGLYIAKSFMKLQGGDISVTSTVNQGSTFVLRIPKKMRHYVHFDGSR